jgi:hypothetical protein
MELLHQLDCHHHRRHERDRSHGRETVHQGERQGRSQRVAIAIRNPTEDDITLRVDAVNLKKLTLRYSDRLL